MEISLLGVNHRTAAVEVREAFALPGELPGKLLRAVRAEDVLDEALVLDTCNRTEFYFVWRTERDFADYLLSHVAHLKGGPAPSVPEALVRLDGRAAVEHLFSVAAGLRSQVVGEGQILTQLRAAYRLAVQERTAHFLLNKLLHRAFRVGKRARAETALGQGAPSVAQAAVELACQAHPTLMDGGILLVGAGQTAELAARALLRHGAARLVVANRSLPAARRLAQELADGRADKGDGQPADRPGCAARPHCRGQTRAEPARPVRTEAIGLEDIPAAMAGVEVVICSTGSPTPVLTAEALARPLGCRGRPIVIVDIGVPRDVDERLGSLPNVRLFNIDDLDTVVARTLAARELEIPGARAIVAQETDRFEGWRQARQVAATIERLRQRLDAVVQAEVERYGGRFDPAGREELARFARSLAGKLLHAPTAFLNDLAANDESDAPAAADMLRRIFNLDEPEDRP